MRLTVVYDACVLYPAPLRSFLMYLAVTDLYHARWTNEIHEEWMRMQRNSLKKPPLSVDEYLASLQRQGLTQTVSNLRQYSELI